jgi:hypothetical protein
MTPVIAALRGVPADAPVATCQFRVWDNRGGTLKSWADALAYNAESNISRTFNVSNIGGQVNQPAYLTGLTSFAAVGTSIPEPSCMTMVGVGLIMLLARRRAGHRPVQQQ